MSNVNYNVLVELCSENIRCRSEKQCKPEVVCLRVLRQSSSNGHATFEADAPMLHCCNLKLDSASKGLTSLLDFVKCVRHTCNCKSVDASRPTHNVGLIGQ
jgi:hypothetical protein